VQTHTKLIKVTESDLDQLKHVNNVRYVQWVNDIAKEHWLKMASDSILDYYFWVLINHNIAYKSQAVLNDTLQLKTYVLESKGVTSTRIVEIYNNDSEKLLAKSETKWCLMGKTTNKPTRITPEISTLFC